MSQTRLRRAGFLPGWQRNPTHLILAVCAFSGLLFFLKREFQLDVLFAESHSLLVTHGVSSAFALLVFGAVLPGHLRAAWIAKRNRASGVLMIAVMSALMLSGLLLYYGSEEIRDNVVLTHLMVGFLAFAVFLLHLLLGRRPQRQPSPPVRFAESRAPMVSPDATSVGN